MACPKHAFDKSYFRPWVLALWILRVWGRHPDACLISFDQGTVAHLVAKLSRASARIGGNLEHIRVSGSVTEEVQIPGDGCPATWNWDMARSLARLFAADEGWPQTPPPPDLRHLLTMAAKPNRGRKRVVVHAGASRPINQWSPKSFALVAGSLAKDFDVIWIEHGGTTGSAPDGTTSHPVKSLSELANLLSNADLFLGNNSGPMHVANALGCAGVVVTGPTALGWDPYWHRERWTVLRHPNLYCAPCERPNKELAGCVNMESPMACLSYWTREMVEAACRERLAVHNQS